ncbi:tripartite tricarboxylate transporter TctB family protein [Acinetobacter schindleri]|uniref:tripartite tricarboxylate transporter TctB family protein n=1 Tax=Acinetobacter TaxID=469 RepID=UPI0012DB5817|nr:MULTISPECIES: tripartite tricarboxylate transporter TctB family protein [Acinetobacter]MCU4322233.1 tripartite tricarboxylate transporter TctB family protein [Acinetobacter schindleri]MCU4520608.1 tripartite tricarboxylate transporter TctB family protein [Acinetobacter schindleri]
MMKSERILTGIIAVCGLFLLIYACSFEAPISYDPVGPKAFPILLMGLITASAVYLTVRPAIMFEPVELGWTKHLLGKLVLCVLALTVYAVIFEGFGFIVATLLMTIAVGKLFNGKTIPVAITGLVLSTCTYYLFDRVLDVPLPLGFFG